MKTYIQTYTSDPPLQTSSELSSSEECLVAEKMRERRERREQNEKLRVCTERLKVRVTNL